MQSYSTTTRPATSDISVVLPEPESQWQSLGPNGLVSLFSGDQQVSYTRSRGCAFFISNLCVCVGSGKSYRARDIAGIDAYWKPALDRWWDGYVPGQNVVLDDFTDEWFNLSYYLRLVDMYPIRVEFKGGYTHFNSALIIITSNFNPADWYRSSAPEGRQALARRVALAEVTNMRTTYIADIAVDHIDP